MRRWRLFIVLTILMFLALIGSLNLTFAQGGPVDRFEINRVDDTAKPDIVIYGTAMDGQRNALPPEALGVQVFENDRPVSAGVQVTTERTGLATVILMDMSGSMAEPGINGSTRFEDARSAALEFVTTRLQDGDLVGVVGFASDIYDGNWLYLGPDRAAAAALIQRLQPETDPQRFNTALFDAGFQAIHMFSEHPDQALRDQIRRMRRAVIAFTDGNDTVSGGSRPGDLVDRARELGVSFDTIGLKSPPGARLRYEGPKDEDARWLAEQTYGLFFDYGSPVQRDALPGFVDRLAGQRNQLRIAYRCTPQEGVVTTRVLVSTGDLSQEDAATVRCDIRPVTARLVQPEDGTTLTCAQQPQVLPILLQPESVDGTVHELGAAEFYKGGELLGTVAAAPYVWNWDISKEKPGKYELSAFIQDLTADNELSTRAVVVTIQSPAAPQVTISKPAAGASVVRNAGGALTLLADVAFPDGCRRPVTVRFNRDGRPIPGSDVLQPPYTYQWNISGLAPGTYEIGAEVIDPAQGAPALAKPISVNLELPLLERILQWLRQSWYIPVLALALLLVLLLLLRTRHQVRQTVSQAVVRVRNTFIGGPSEEALGMLKGVRGPVQDRVLRLNGRRNTVGREPTRADVILQDDGYVSSVHFMIEFTEGGTILLTDLNSRHGTFVNGQRVAPDQPVYLRGGERIRAGESEFEFTIPSRRGTRMVQRS